MTMLLRLRRDETGTALIAALILMVVISGIIVNVSVSSMGAMDAAKRKTDQVVGMPVTDSGAHKYLKALDTGLTDESLSYNLNSAAMDEIAGGHVKAVGPADVGYLRPSDVAAIPAFVAAGLHTTDASVRGRNDWTVREPIVHARQAGSAAAKPAGYGYWQIYAMHKPQFDGSAQGGNLIVFFRGWVTDLNNRVTTEPRLVRVEYRPGRFSDYQMVADGPITLEHGAKVTGPVHSNGYRDTLLGPSNRLGILIRSRAKCGDGASFSTRSGSITRHSSSNCKSTTRYPGSINNGQSFSMLRIGDSVRALSSRCGTAMVLCSGNFGDASTYFVRMQPGSATTKGTITVKAGGVTRLSRSYGDGDSVAFLFPGNVRISGSTRARVTIAAFNRDDDKRFSSPSIHLDGNTTYTGPTGSLGLIAQGDVVPNIESCRVGSASVKYVRAAIAAASGTFAFDPKYRFTTDPGVALPRCLGKGNALNYTGSIAGHYGPYLRHHFGDDDDNDYVDVGYQYRNYRYDDKLYHNPPPFYPTTGPWQIAHWKDANLDCVGAVKCR